MCDHGKDGTARAQTSQSHAQCNDHVWAVCLVSAHAGQIQLVQMCSLVAQLFNHGSSRSLSMSSAPAVTARGHRYFAPTVNSQSSPLPPPHWTCASGSRGTLTFNSSAARRLLRGSSRLAPAVWARSRPKPCRWRCELVRMQQLSLPPALPAVQGRGCGGPELNSNSVPNHLQINSNSFQTQVRIDSETF